MWSALLPGVQALKKKSIEELKKKQEEENKIVEIIKMED